MTTSPHGIGSRWRSGVIPGVYENAATQPSAAEVRMDVAGFIGLCERGPVATPVALTSLDAFEEIFGGRGGGRLLPEVVRLFFLNGGRRCVIVRAVAFGPVPGSGNTAEGAWPTTLSVPLLATASGPLHVHARDPGSWGDALRLRTRVFETPEGRRAELEVRLGDRRERFGPCALGRGDKGTLLAEIAAGSRLVRPTADDWEAGQVLRDVLVTDRIDPLHFANSTTPASPGSDGAGAFTRDHLWRAPAAFAATFPSALVPWRDRPGMLDALGEWNDHQLTEPVAVVHVCDLVHPPFRAPATVEPLAVSHWSPSFSPCVEAPDEPDPVPVNALWPGLVANNEAALAATRARVVAWGRENLAIILFDLPPDVDQASELDLFGGDVPDEDLRYAVVHGPWLQVAGEGDEAVLVPPGGVVAGAIARREGEIGPHGVPANLRVTGALRLHVDPLLPDQDRLFAARINLLRADPDAIRIYGSRTCSRTREWAHLPARRLVDYLKRQLALDAREMVFEPRDSRLCRRAELLAAVRLNRLHAGRAFAARSPAEAWFARAHASGDARLVVEIGVAPVSPTEFLVFRLVLNSDGMEDFLA